ncbi:MAG: hypothetical protein QOI64_2432 [Solirubrobacteraceae bacterium]|jgi:hypothetical protein|nr:hypothetical protein [Solirubrobacteraceae bacterium]
MQLKTLAVTAVATLAVAGSAAAAQAPTLGPPTTFKAGQTTPIDVAGNHLHQGQTIRKGTRLLRWMVTMHGASNARVTLSCPAGTRHVGLATYDHPRIAFKLAKGSSYGHRTIKVQYYTARAGVDANGATGHTYALCKG